jgi:hypothetical protein
MIRFYFLCTVLFVAQVVTAQTADTTIVQTFTHQAQNNPQTAYDSPGRRWFDFPASDNGVSYQKILMYYNLKCFENGTAGNLGFPCGEWDYLTYTYLYDHTGQMDSVEAAHPRYLMNGQNFDVTSYTSIPLFDIQQVEVPMGQLQIENELYALTSESTNMGQGPLRSEALGRHQYLYTASELSAGGLQAGELLQLSLYAESAQAANFNPVTIKGKWVTQTAITQWDNTNWTTLFTGEANAIGNDWLNFNFVNPWSWDGTSDLLLEFSYANVQPTPEPLFAVEELSYDCHIGGAGDERYIHFDGNDRVEVPTAAFENISDQITIAFWINGDADVQPADGTVFEGVGSNNERQLNVHLPWSNGRVYWDAGNNGGYDRIDKAAAASSYEGIWNHWAFTKNATTGSMKIYLNGVLWHSGTNLDNSMDGIVAFAIGAAKSWNNFYRGAVDEFAIWNTELDAATIAAWMNTDVNASHPAWANLQCFYSFDGALGAYVQDDSGNNHHGVVIGNPQRPYYDAASWWRNATVDQQRPVLRIFNGTATWSQEIVTNSWPIERAPATLTEYVISDYTPTIIDNSLVWTGDYTYTYNEDGVAIDSSVTVLDIELTNSTWSYFNRPFEIVNRYELNRFITMYGIGLDLGDNGWTWVTDVTDFAPLLRDSVELEAGNWQELLDMKFVFIEGTPAREVQRVERVWDGNYGLSTFDQQVTMQTLEKLPGEASWKLLTTNTGHGFGFDNNNCGEFCNNIQTVEVNGASIASWDILQECADNPLYPQGGTWIYDRAGWCPGMNSTTKEFELTPHVGAGNTFTVDYDITNDPYGNYVFFGTLIGYGPNLHQHDPEIDQILAPSAQLIHSRWNPMCNRPRFVLRNKGAQPLTDLNIVFGVEGGEPQTYHWTGSLGFMESEVVELTTMDNTTWWGDDETLLTFFIELGFSTDGVDDNPTNNYGESYFYRPATYQYTNLDDNRLIIQLKTNASNLQSSYTLYNSDGNVVFERSNFPAPNTTYRDTLQLNSGCYMFHLRDSGEDGLSFFANNDGNGNCKLDRISGLDFINFENDFGKEIIHHFNWNTNLISVDERDQLAVKVNLYPNPNQTHVMINAKGLDRTITVHVVDVAGKVVQSETYNRRFEGEEVRVETSLLSEGWYTVVVSDGLHSVQVPMIHTY